MKWRTSIHMIYIYTYIYIYQIIYLYIYIYICHAIHPYPFWLKLRATVAIVAHMSREVWALLNEDDKDSGLRSMMAPGRFARSYFKRACQRYDWDGRSMSRKKFREKYEGNGDWEWAQARPATDDIASVMSYFDREASSKSWSALERLLFKGAEVTSTAVLFEMIVKSLYIPLRIRASYLARNGYDRSRLLTDADRRQMEAIWQSWMEENSLFSEQQRKRRSKSKYNVFAKLANKEVRSMQLSRLLMRDGVADIPRFTRSVRALVSVKTTTRMKNRRRQMPMHQMMLQFRSPSPRRARDRSRSHRRRWG